MKRSRNVPSKHLSFARISQFGRLTAVLAVALVVSAGTFSRVALADDYDEQIQALQSDKYGRSRLM